MSALVGLSRKSGFINAKTFGAKSDGLTDNLAVFNAALAAFGSTITGEMYWPGGGSGYVFSDTLVIDRPLKLRGSGSRQAPATTFIHASGKDFVRVTYQTGPVAGGGAGSVLEDLYLIPNGVSAAAFQVNHAYAVGDVVYPIAGYAGSNGPGFVFLVTAVSGDHLSGGSEPSWPSSEGGTVVSNHVTFTAHSTAGIKLLGAATLRRVNVSTVAGDAFSVLPQSGDNAIGWLFEKCLASSCLGWGFVAKGFNSASGHGITSTAIQNGVGGVWEESDNGNTWENMVAEANGPGGVGVGFKVPTSAASNRSLFDGCYQEMGQTSSINGKSMWINGKGSQEVYGAGLIFGVDRASSFYSINYAADNGANPSAYMRFGGTAGAGYNTLMEFGYSDDSNTRHTWSRDQINTVGYTGWVGWLSNYSPAKTPFAISLAGAAEGAGHFWVPNDLYRGDNTNARLREVVSLLTIPTSGSFIHGDRSIGPSPHDVSGAYGAICLESGSPGRWGIVQAKATKSVTGSTALSAHECYIGVTALSGAITLTLPETGVLSATIHEGHEIIVRDETLTAGTAGEIRIEPGAGGQINGDTSYVAIRNPGGTLKLTRRDGSWWTNDNPAAMVAGPAAATALKYRDQDTYWTDHGASSRVDFTLPSADTIGLRYRFASLTGNGVRVIASGTDAIYVGSSASSSGGRIDTTSITGAIDLVCLTAGFWVATSIVGTWDIT